MNWRRIGFATSAFLISMGLTAFFHAHAGGIAWSIGWIGGSMFMLALEGFKR